MQRETLAAEPKPQLLLCCHTTVPEVWALTCTAHSGIFLSTQKMCDLQRKFKTALSCHPTSSAFTLPPNAPLLRHPALVFLTAQFVQAASALGMSCPGVQAQALDNRFDPGMLLRIP